MGLKYFASNRLERLAQDLAKVVAEPLDSPLAQEIILVQSRGMSRWVTLQLAELTGVCMNFQFPFPRAFLAGILKGAFPKADLDQYFSAQAMAWRINSLLPELEGKESFAIVRNYLEEDDGLKRFQLSQKIANLFDQYLVYRPEMILQWERHQETEANQLWQAELWRELIKDSTGVHLARISEQLEDQLATVAPDFPLPKRLSVFGISSLPPLYLRVLFALARHTEVNFFEVNPSQEYFGDDVAPKLRAKKGLSLSDPTQAGNPLLTSLGRLNRDSIEVRLELDERAGFIVQEQPTHFIEPERDTLLHSLQSDLLNAQTSSPSHGSSGKNESYGSGDRSLQVHACHSPMRELEVLYDQLLDLLAKDPSLRPRDILVMTPKIEDYAPYIEAVFGSPESLDRKIPFSLADRRPTSSSPVIETFLALLALPGGRFTAPEILSLLDQEAIRQRFGFTEESLELFRQWIVGVNIRWGIDGSHRAELELPQFEANTWRAGIKRLLLGFAMAGHDSSLFESILPFDQIEGASAEILGRFITALEAFMEVASVLPGQRPLSVWAGELEQLLTRFFPVDKIDPASLQPIREALEELRKVAGLLDPTVDFRLIRYYLGQQLDQSEQRGGFLTGGVTFCALQPMRSIPARVIALIGMGDQNFPRPASAPGFDLMAAKRQCGDRSPREDDRYTFLEAIISAREILYVSYVGRSIVHNTEIPPSVLVSELCDYLDQAFAFPEGKTSRQALTTHHRLHAFSSRYFDQSTPALFSYSQANARAAANASAANPPPDFFRDDLPSPSEELQTVTLQNLIRFFSNPSKYFIQNRLGLRLDHEEELFLEAEPFALAPLESYQLKQELVSHGLAGSVLGAEQIAARGLLPLGEVGKAGFESLKKSAERFRKNVESEIHGRSALEPLLVDLPIGGFRITGEIDGIYGSTGKPGINAPDSQISQASQTSQPLLWKIQYRCAKGKPKDLLKAWVTHLTLCALFEGAPGCQTTLLDTERVLHFPPVNEPRPKLLRLLDLYWRGLQAPLPFFPASAEAFTETLLKKEGESDARQIALFKAHQKWNGSDYTHGEQGEKTDPYFALCFGDADPLNEEFQELATEILELPLSLAKA